MATDWPPHRFTNFPMMPEKSDDPSDAPPMLTTFGLPQNTTRLDGIARPGYVAQM
jgi:hypothetical protein